MNAFLFVIQTGAISDYTNKFIIFKQNDHIQVVYINIKIIFKQIMNYETFS